MEETVEEIFRKLREKAMMLRRQIENAQSPVKKLSLFDEYQKIMRLLTLKWKEAFLCHCVTIEGFTKSNGIEIKVEWNQCVIIVP